MELDITYTTQALERINSLIYATNDKDLQQKYTNIANLISDKLIESLEQPEKGA